MQHPSISSQPSFCARSAPLLRLVGPCVSHIVARINRAIARKVARAESLAANIVRGLLPISGHLKSPPYQQLPRCVTHGVLVVSRRLLGSVSVAQFAVSLANHKSDLIAVWPICADSIHLTALLCRTFLILFGDSATAAPQSPITLHAFKRRRNDSRTDSVDNLLFRCYCPLLIAVISHVPERDRQPTLHRLYYEPFCEPRCCTTTPRSIQSNRYSFCIPRATTSA
jgi:hypothetical protein